MAAKDIVEDLIASYGLAVVVSCGGAVAFVVYTIADAFYQVFFSPLSDIPGPFLCKITPFPNAIKLLTGIQPFWIRSVHLKYGPLVRLGPRHVAYAAPEAWKDIMVYKPNVPGGKYIPHFGRDPAMYAVPPNGVHQIHSCPDDAEHTRIRRLMSHAFSDRALKQMEPLLRKYINLLVTRLHERIDSPEKGKVNLVAWLNYTTFDIIGDLTFGASFGCLQDSALHPWIVTIFDALRAATFFCALGQFPALKKVVTVILPPSIKKIQRDHFNITTKKVDERLASGSERPDFMTLLAAAPTAENKLNREELHSNAVLLVLAGSETSATALSGMFFNLLQNPDSYARLVEELRTAVTREEDITISNILPLRYMQACIEESIRVYTPVPTDITRMTPPEGKMLAGHWLPGGTKTSVCFSAILTDPGSFTDPLEFRPQRWLREDRRYATDKLEASQPFSAGPRNCIGKNLAYVEMRLILAKLLWNFDFELCEESRDWRKQKIFLLWEKRPLMVKLKRVVR